MPRVNIAPAMKMARVHTEFAAGVGWAAVRGAPVVLVVGGGGWRGWEEGGGGGGGGGVA